MPQQCFDNIPHLYLHFQLHFHLHLHEPALACTCTSILHVYIVRTNLHPNSSLLNRLPQACSYLPPTSHHSIPSILPPHFTPRPSLFMSLSTTRLYTSDPTLHPRVQHSPFTQSARWDVCMLPYLLALGMYAYVHACNASAFCICHWRATCLRCNMPAMQDAVQCCSAMQCMMLVQCYNAYGKRQDAVQ